MSGEEKFGDPIVIEEEVAQICVILLKDAIQQCDDALNQLEPDDSESVAGAIVQNKKRYEQALEQIEEQL